jgi:hypothetical protein
MGPQVPLAFGVLQQQLGGLLHHRQLAQQQWVGHHAAGHALALGADRAVYLRRGQRRQLLIQGGDGIEVALGRAHPYWVVGLQLGNLPVQGRQGSTRDGDGKCDAQGLGITRTPGADGWGGLGPGRRPGSARRGTWTPPAAAGRPGAPPASALLFRPIGTWLPPCPQVSRGAGKEGSDRSDTPAGTPGTKPDDSQKDRVGTSFRPVVVFNAVDLEGDALAGWVAQRQAEAAGVERSEPERLAAAESLLTSWPVPVSYRGKRACFLPQIDRIQLPERARPRRTACRARFSDLG